MTDDASEDFPHIRDSFCVYPFLQLAISPSGVVRPCSAFKRLIEMDGRAMSVYEHPVEEIWNSGAMRSIRRSMVDGKPVDGCANCYKQAEQKLRSVGEAANDAYKSGWLNPRNETFADLKQRASSSNFTLPNGPEQLDINVGNLCNLKCRMCNSGSSSSIAADPVQQKWAHASSAFPARWKNLETVIAPVRALGVSYDGLSEIDWSNDEPVAWTNGQAQITVNTDGVELSGIVVTIAEDRPLGLRLRLLVNSHAIYDGVPALGPWSANFSLEDIHPVDSELHISIESDVLMHDGHATATGVGIQHLALLRATRGRNSISISRLASGKQWFQDMEFMESDLFYDLPSVTMLTLMGGEPLLIKEVRDIMRYIVSKGRSKDITLALVTNGTVVGDEWSELAVQFKSLIITVSLDGYGELNSYIRHPSEWEAIKSNIKRLQEIPNAYVYVNLTVQVYNMLHITKLIDFCEQAGLDLRFYPLFSPHHLSCNIMPNEIRAVAAERLRRYAMRNQPDLERPNRYVDYRKSILELAGALQIPNTHDIAAAVREFMIFTNDLDQSRSQKFSNVGAELIAMLDAQGYPWIDDTRFTKFAGPSGMESIAS